MRPARRVKRGSTRGPKAMAGEGARPVATGVDLAVIRLCARVPGASNAKQYWNNLVAGVESIRFFSDAELIAAGIDADLVRDPRYVKAAPVLPGVGEFDAAFFGYSPREARVIDPQQRLFLECA